MDVNLLMFAAWHGQVRGLGLSEADLQPFLQATEFWQSNIVIPIRALRRSLKRVSQTGVDGDFDTIRNAVKALELEAERLQQSRLQDVSTRLYATDNEGCGTTLAIENILRILSHFNVLAAPEVAVQLSVLRNALQD